MQNILILNSNNYNITDEKTQKTIKGIKIHYIFTDDVSPVIIDDDKKGYPIANISLHTDKLSKLIAVPGIYEPIFNMAVTSKGKVEQKLTDIKYICSVSELYSNKK